MQRTRFSHTFFFISISMTGCNNQSGGVNIWDAIDRSDKQQIRQYAAAGGDIEVRNNRGETPLLAAFKSEVFESYETLLELGASPNIQANNGDAVMVYAAGRSDSRWLREALAHGGDPDYFNERAPPRHRGTALLSAIQAGQSQCALMLIDAGADVNLLPKDEPSHSTPLVATLYSNDFEVTLRLLERGADYRSNAGTKAFLPLLKERLSFMTYRSEEIRQQRDAVVSWLKSRGVEFPEEQ